MTARSALAAVLLAAAAPALAARPSPSPEIVALREEIAALKLDRALSLTPDQARALLPVLKQAAAQVEAARARAEAARPAQVAALTQARDELRAGGTVSPATEQALRQARAAAFAGDRAEGKALRQQALAILTPAQVQALRSLHLGPAQPPTGAPAGDVGATPVARRGAGLRRLVLLGVLTSDAFQSLVEARAR